MRKVSFRLTDSEYKEIERYRGNRTISEYVRALLFAHHEEARKETVGFQTLFRDVTLIRETIATCLRDLPNQTALIALAEYLKRVISIANPPAYAHHETELQQHLQALKTNISREG